MLFIMLLLECAVLREDTCDGFTGGLRIVPGQDARLQCIFHASLPL
jgi:hypothetical protein